MKSFTNTIPLSYEQLIEIENQIYDEEIIADNIEKKEFFIDDVLKRKTEIFEDKTYNLPQKKEKNIKVEYYPLIKEKKENMYEI